MKLNDCNFGLPLNESVKNNIKSVLKPFKNEAVQNWQSSASKSITDAEQERPTEKLNDVVWMITVVTCLEITKSGMTHVRSRPVEIPRCPRTCLTASRSMVSRHKRARLIKK